MAEKVEKSKAEAAPDAVPAVPESKGPLDGSPVKQFVASPKAKAWKPVSVAEHNAYVDKLSKAATADDSVESPPS